MSGLENKLRAALRDTAGEIPADPPPLRLPPARDPARPARSGPASAAGSAGPPRWPPRPWSSRWSPPRWPWSTAGPGGRRAKPAGRAAVPPYYVALTAPAYPDVYDGNATAAEVRATATGAVLAKVVPPKPYVHFAGVTAAADHRTFVLVAEEKSHPPEQQQPGEGPHPYYQPSRFYLLRFDPGTGRVSLRALPAAFIPANAEVHDMALSPDGTSLAADIGLDYVRLSSGRVRPGHGERTGVEFQELRLSATPAAAGSATAARTSTRCPGPATESTSRSSGLTAPGGRHTVRSGCST